MTEAKKPGSAMFWGFIAVMSLLTMICIWLGNWQLERLAEKDALVALVDQRLDQPPVALPAIADWPGVGANLEFQPVTLTGRFAHDEAIRVFTSLSASTARGAASGPGYWIVTPFVLDTGGTVFVNRGFVPEQMADFFVDDPDGNRSTQTITGLIRPAEQATMFTPAPDSEEGIEWVRDPVRMAALVAPDLGPLAPFTIDQAAGAPGELPQGGETVVEFPNNHLGYALTWFGFAIITPIMLGFWIWRQRRPVGSLV